jgi:hypothetical protein
MRDFSSAVSYARALLRHSIDTLLGAAVHRRCRFRIGIVGVGALAVFLVVLGGLVRVGLIRVVGLSLCGFIRAIWVYAGVIARIIRIDGVGVSIFLTLRRER